MLKTFFSLITILCLTACASSGVPYIYNNDKKPNQPGVIVLHSSYGLDSNEIEYARFLKNQGFAVAVVDYHSNGGTDNIAKAYDQLIADKDRIGLVGFSRGAHIAISTADLSNRFQNRKYSAIVSFYIGPYVPSNSEFVPPILFLHGDQDHFVKADRILNFCQIQKQIYQKECLSKIFNDTKHSFDKVKSKYQGYDPIVTKESYQQSLDFLNQYLK